MREANDSHVNAHHVEKQEYMDHSHAVLTQKRPLPLSLENYVRCYRTTSRSQPCPLLPTAKFNLVLAGTRTLLHQLANLKKPEDFFRQGTEKPGLCLCPFFNLKTGRKCLSDADLTLVEGQGFQPASETVEARENTSACIQC